jgi:hypothetical protein
MTLHVRDFSTSAASLNGLAPMGVEDACARETRVATKAYDLWIATGNPDATYNWYRAVRRTGLHIPGVQPPAVFFVNPATVVRVPATRSHAVPTQQVQGV